MSSTLAGNFTLLGSVANLIVAERARAEGIPISFWAYFKVGAPLTALTLAAGTGLADVALGPGSARHAEAVRRSAPDDCSKTAERAPQITFR